MTDERPPKKPMSDARVGGMVATVVLVALFLFVLWLVLSAG
ncbi:MAG: hypothetical protein V4712_10640 [Pseudomonadota bacterium]